MSGNVDYADSFSWLAKPDLPVKKVDVFYVYPTIYADSEPVNMDISSDKLRNNARGLLTAQAGVYAESANLFAPFYRQQSAATQSMAVNNSDRAAYDDPAFLLGCTDVEEAFRFYLEQFNPTRPFILAGHSQGSMVILELLRKFFGDRKLQERLVAAYAIGYSLTLKDLDVYPHLALAQGESDTGVIVTYNTQGEGAFGSPVLLAGAVGINPLNWCTDSTAAAAELNLGAVFFRDSTGEILEEVAEFCGAYLDTTTGVLVVTDLKDTDVIDISRLGRWPDKVYHRYDYAFFYNNLKHNVAHRIAAYLEQSGM